MNAHGVARLALSALFLVYVRRMCIHTKEVCLSRLSVRLSRLYYYLNSSLRISGAAGGSSTAFPMSPAFTSPSTKPKAQENMAKAIDANSHKFNWPIKGALSPGDTSECLTIFLFLFFSF